MNDNAAITGWASQAVPFPYLPDVNAKAFCFAEARWLLKRGDLLRNYLIDRLDYLCAISRNTGKKYVGGYSSGNFPDLVLILPVR